VNVSNEDSCSIGGKRGLLLSNGCYVPFASSDMQQQQQQAGVSWFKAVSHCASLGSSLASIDINSSSPLAEYLSSSGLGGQRLWIGLHRRPWIWVQRFDPGKYTSSTYTAITTCSSSHAFSSETLALYKSLTYLLTYLFINRISGYLWISTRKCTARWPLWHAIIEAYILTQFHIYVYIYSDYFRIYTNSE